MSTHDGSKAEAVDVTLPALDQAAMEAWVGARGLDRRA
jgi:hypothetical protein